MLRFVFVRARARAGIAIELAAAFVSAAELRCTVPAQVAGSFRVAASLDSNGGFLCDVDDVVVGDDRLL